MDDDEWDYEPDEELDEEEQEELQYRESVAEEDPDDHEDADFWDDDPFDGYEREPEPDVGCSWCEDLGCRRCIPSRWDRIRWAVRERLDRLMRRRTAADDPWGLSVGPPF